jgi:pilus assembly protein Flp/PilA
MIFGSDLTMSLEMIVHALFRRFITNVSGATAIEYGLIAGLIGVVIIGALSNDGLHLKSTFNAVGSALN